MEESIFLFLALIVLGGFLLAVVLPIVALAISLRSKRKVDEQISELQSGKTQLSSDSLQQVVQQLSQRVERLEAALVDPSVLRPGPKPRVPDRPVIEPCPQSEPPPTEEPHTAPTRHVPPVDVTQPRPAFSPSIGLKNAAQIESLIGRRLIGWVSICLILFAAAFFLKYAFDNRWIGELGRVAIGVAAGISMSMFGYRHHKRGWRVFSQILTAGGVILLYLSVYAAFAYYHLASQKAAFVFLAILVAEAAGLSYLYNAPAIAIMALIGGFLSPVLLRSGHDQYQSLFGYIVALDMGALALLKRWPGLSSIAFAGTHLLFWLWFEENYHPKKLLAVMVFQTAVFLIFLVAQLGRQLLKKAPATVEDLSLTFINPFTYFATSYHLLSPQHHEWLGVFAIAMAIIYAGAAKVLLSRSAGSRIQTLSLIAVALTFVTIAMPIQLRANWITIAWSVEGLVMLWAGLETRVLRLRIGAFILFFLAVGRLLFWDTPNQTLIGFTPLLNRYFLSSLITTACLFGAALLLRRAGRRNQISTPVLELVFTLTAIVTLWFVLSIETYNYFAARANRQATVEDTIHERWLGQMALSVLWSAYAAGLAAIGFVRRSAAVRWTALALFSLTILKAMVIDIAQLQQLYRIIVFFVLGVLLLVVAWGYHRAFHSSTSNGH
jgi:uncharacterized membrane protein